MEKRKVLVTVEQASDGSYWCHTEDAINKGHFNSGTYRRGGKAGFA